ncbi:MAG: DUF2442 domain-containing protein [Prolixibacteraceae bacterium]|jgi:hypothetical protein|nr:DUF2442 domain-containing protein [Prolixibacteraceae bacterium]MBT6764633.1 DUF2442 domain-containing protein [Prolixibacteraceae bacterium]MBT6998466.1 DUF2442 domain-containing protein [Prolixibacteraceae bacterium]MBT7394393.1 DUF2442 domain-containing protein [Prolixibacteraceae bacterium]
MKIVEESSVDYDIGFCLISAEYISKYKILIVFDDSIEKIVDFDSFLSKSQHPSIRKYQNIINFKQFKIINGNLNWNNYDMIFPLSDLRNGTIK